MIIRDAVLDRAHGPDAVWAEGSVDYSQETHHQPDGYREDCSGGVSCWWKLSASYTTETLVSARIMYEIDPANMRPGDAIGDCGPGTGGSRGHIQLVIQPMAGRLNRIIEQSGGHPGPVERVASRPDHYKVYRYTRIADVLPTISKGATGSAVKLAQQRLNAAGANLVEDGVFGPRTDAATRTYQGGHHLEVDGVIGPITWSYL